MRAGLLAVLLWGAACAKQEALPLHSRKVARSVVLLVAADLRGQLSPCGCSQNMRGGIAKLAQQLHEARKGPSPVLFVEAGNSLFSKPELSDDEVPQEDRKAKALAEALKTMGVATKVLGPLDLARPEGLQLPKQPLGSVRMLEAGGHLIAVVAAQDAKSLARLSKEARGNKPSFVLGVLHQPLVEAQKAAAEPGLEADLVLAVASQREGEDNRLVRTAVPVVQLQSKGRSLLRLDLSFLAERLSRVELVKSQSELDQELSGLETRIELVRQQVNELDLGEELRALRKAKLEELIGRRMALASATALVPEGKNSLSVRFVPIEANLPSLPAVAELVAAYDREVGALNLQWAKLHGQDCPAPDPGESAFVGNEPCRVCHANAFAAYEASRHSKAFGSLEKVGKSLHLDCIKCHVTGADRPGGVCRLDRLEGRKHVGCESCHGPGSLHSAAPSTARVLAGVGPEQCQRCHDRENSPHFEYERFREAILGPGHGKPLTDR